MKSKGLTLAPTLSQSRFIKAGPKSQLSASAVSVVSCPRNRAFTLIELLIVIAIIGILASVVLASLNAARLKGTDAAIKTDLTSIRVQSSIWYDDNGQMYASTGNTYPLGTCPTATSTGNIFADLKIFEAVSAAYTLSGGVANSQCVATADAWAVAVQLKTSDGQSPANPSPDAWCTDSVGSSRSFSYDATYTGIAGAINEDACR